MKIGENQKTQLIILCCLIVVVAAVGVHRMIGTGNKAAPRASQQSQVREEASASEEVAQADAGLLLPVPGEQKPRDPFIPQVGPKVVSSQSPFRAGRTLAGLAASAPIPPMPFLTSEPIRVNNPSSAEEKAPELRLTGVIEGNTDVAIIRIGDDARYIVREGQVMDGGYIVESISRAGVRLRYNKETLILRLGSSIPG